MKPAEILQFIGLTESETKVYLALLDLGSSSTGAIIKQAKIPQGKVYVILDKLIDKGIVTYTIKSHIKFFQAKDPKTLVEWFSKVEEDLNEKKSQLQQLLPKLQAKHNEASYEKQVEIYEGTRAFKLLYDSILEEANNLLIIGSTSNTPEEIENYLKLWHKKRISKKIQTKFIYSLKRKEFAKDREKMKCTQVKYLDLPESPSWTTIFNDKIITVTLDNTITCFLTKDKHIAKAQSDYFNVMWQVAK